MSRAGSARQHCCKARGLSLMIMALVLANRGPSPLCPRLSAASTGPLRCALLPLQLFRSNFSTTILHRGRHAGTHREHCLLCIHCVPLAFLRCLKAIGGAGAACLLTMGSVRRVAAFPLRARWRILLKLACSSRRVKNSCFVWKLSGANGWTKNSRLSSESLLHEADHDEQGRPDEDARTFIQIP